ncbi:cytochrome P450 [Polyplosphaeria fusca]|uniref:Cytochrome P450 n=1 Tax=Polyplosphaeria fusca TaxID=682080 RepID=A0A9P4R332_9PLEO|nr:cytochrome P450 [Polyplosphaeria fusca]
METLLKLPLLGLCLFFAYVVIKAINNVYFHPISTIPGPSAWAASRLPFIYSLTSGNLTDDLHALHHKHGPILRTAPDEITFAHPEAWPDIFQPRPGRPQFLKDPIWWPPAPGQPSGIGSAIDPQTHAKLRKLLTPAFTTSALKSQEDIVQRYVNLLIERLEALVLVNPQPSKSAQVDLLHWFNYVTFDIFGDLGFGESFGCLENSEYHPWVSLLFKFVRAGSAICCMNYYPWINSALMKCLPQSMKNATQQHYQLIVNKVAQRLNWELERPDIMSHVIKQRKGGEGYSVDQINATFMSLTIAGSETTATTLCGAVSYLLQDGERMQMLKEEIRGAFANKEDMTLDALRDMEYLNAVLHETFRLCPAIPRMMPRIVPPGGDTVCGVRLPGGTRVAVNQWSLGREPKYWHRAAEFLPERWLSPATDDPKSPFFNDRREVVNPFSMGPRNCMGQHLAWAELRAILGKLVWNFDLEAVEEKFRWEDQRTYSLVEKMPLVVRMKMRTA